MGVGYSSDLQQVIYSIHRSSYAEIQIHIPLTSRWQELKFLRQLMFMTMSYIYHCEFRLNDVNTPVLVLIPDGRTALNEEWSRMSRGVRVSILKRWDQQELINERVRTALFGPARESVEDVLPTPQVIAKEIIWSIAMQACHQVLVRISRYPNQRYALDDQRQTFFERFIPGMKEAMVDVYMTRVYNDFVDVLSKSAIVIAAGKRLAHCRINPNNATTPYEVTVLDPDRALLDENVEDALEKVLRSCFEVHIRKASKQYRNLGFHVNNIANIVVQQLAPKNEVQQLAPKNEV